MTVFRQSDPNTKIHFYFIDALRGIAAFWVVLFHTDGEGKLSNFTAILPDWIVTVVFKWGSFGVPIFFVLSGFVISHSLRTAKIDLSFFSRFTLRRAIRLNPPYYASIFVALCFAFVAFKFKGEAEAFEMLSLNQLLAHLVYLQDILGLGQINDVYWTLCLEVQFYLVFCVLIGLSQWLERRTDKAYGRGIVFVCAAAIALLWPANIIESHIRPGLFLPHWHGFLLGVFAYWAWNRQLKTVFFYFYCALLLILAAINTVSFTIVCVITAIFLLEVGRANRMDLLKQRWLQFLGLISYSLYLTHVPLIGAVLFIAQKLLGRSVWADGFCLIIQLITAILFARVMWQLVEKPSISWSRKVKLVNSTERS